MGEWLPFKTTGWGLHRAIYNHYGLRYVEGSWPKERFEAEAACGYGFKWVIGVRVKRNKHWEIAVVVEGAEEYLKYILELVKKNEPPEEPKEEQKQKQKQ